MARVALLFNRVSAGDSVSELDVLQQCTAVERSLLRQGHQVQRVGCTLDLQTVRHQLLLAAPDVVFNLVEALGGKDRLASLAMMLLESMGVPFTGSSSLAEQLTNRKPFAKQRLSELGLPTPAWLLLGDRAWRGVATGRKTPARAIVKAESEHSSLGLSEDSVIDCGSPQLMTVLQQRIRAAEAEFGTPFFAEEYIHGREFNLSLLGGGSEPQVLVPAEIRFEGYHRDRPRVVGFAAKWDENSVAYQQTPRSFSYGSGDRPLLDDLSGLARSCWYAFELAGYARVDFRVDADGQPWILELNTNPCLSPDGGFAAAVEKSGIAWDTAVARILDSAMDSAMPRRTGETSQ